MEQNRPQRIGFLILAIVGVWVALAAFNYLVGVR